MVEEAPYPRKKNSKNYNAYSQSNFPELPKPLPSGVSALNQKTHTLRPDEGVFHGLGTTIPSLPIYEPHPAHMLP